MSVFVYRAYDASGKIVTGTMEAQEREAVIAKLQQSRHFPLKVEKEAGEEKSGQFDLLLKFKWIGTKEVLIFSQQLASLLEAGIQLDRSLSILIELTENKKLKLVVEDVQTAVHGGSSFGDALAQHPEAFSKIYVNMVRAGESGGVLEQVMRRLAEFLENTQGLKSDIISAMIYPAILTVVAGGSVALLLTFVVPKFTKLFKDMGQSLPWATQLLLSISGAIRNSWWLIIIGSVLLVLGIKYYVSTPAGKLQWDTLKLKLPLIGLLVRKIEVSRFSRTFGTLINSGVPILKGLAIVREIVSNALMSKAMANVQSGLKEGEGITAPLRASGLFPPLALHMISIGEETGQLDTMLLKVADNYDAEVRITVKRLMGFLEPILILVMGLVVGFIVLAMLMAVFSINDLPM